MSQISSKDIVEELLQKAKKAQFTFEQFSQKQVDEVVTAVAWAICKPSNLSLIHI